MRERDVLVVHYRKMLLAAASDVSECVLFTCM
jgi:hypothetical protein